MSDPTATAAQTPLDAANDVWFDWSGREGRGSAEFTVEVVRAVQRAIGERLIKAVSKEAGL